MKPSILFGLVLVSVVIGPGESSALKSAIRDEIVELLEDVNNWVGQVSTEANDYFLQKLENYTEIQEWSVDIQVKVVTGVTELAFDVFNAYKDYVISKYGSETETKILTCIGDEEVNFLAAVQNAARENGWCNNRLAANLTRAFQDVTKNLISISDTLAGDLTSLSKCIFGDDLCFTSFIAKVVALVQAELNTSGDTLLTAVEDVGRVYSIMFGQDVPKCNAEYLGPLLLNGTETAISSISQCILS